MLPEAVEAQDLRPCLLADRIQPSPLITRGLADRACMSGCDDMPVILAIESDRRQRSQITSIVRGLGAELVLAESADRALASLEQRVPDVILTRRSCCRKTTPR